MRRRTFIGAVGSGVFGAGLIGSGVPSGGQPAQAELDSLFARFGFAGTFVLLEEGRAAPVVIDMERARRRHPPASTFKIANSLIALETGAVKDADEILPYGGRPQPIKAWERDMSMREALPLSNVPIYQEIARRVGIARYRDFLARLDYGNRETGDVVDRFWLDGPLEISAFEQARFVGRLARGGLPVSARSQAIVRDLLRLESAAGRTLYGKTGWVVARTPQIGWWTGWVDRGGRSASFSLNIEAGSMEVAPQRLSLGRALLERLGI